ncbi:hypothetical protein Purlil1_9430 [Purpureocillium lilacinum]|uniref:Uncharacterized protein n=1 Tax=Purpureocillium lilacinum TaxID=33203 RepID=A0ABR0BQN0_PURLI|nr:hypothetical protein Purlil1_9430 [Purpureocillium lilacinum]
MTDPQSRRQPRSMNDSRDLSNAAARVRNTMIGGRQLLRARPWDVSTIPGTGTQPATTTGQTRGETKERRVDDAEHLPPRAEAPPGTRFGVGSPATAARGGAAPGRRRPGSGGARPGLGSIRVHCAPCQSLLASRPKVIQRAGVIAPNSRLLLLLYCRVDGTACPPSLFCPGLPTQGTHSILDTAGADISALGQPLESSIPGQTGPGQTAARIVPFPTSCPPLRSRRLPLARHHCRRRRVMFTYHAPTSWAPDDSTARRPNERPSERATQALYSV